MRKLVAGLVLASGLSAPFVSASSAAPVTGFETQYSAVSGNCTIPLGALDTCEQAINAYAAALAAAVELEVANQSFTELRSEVFTVSEPNEPFQVDGDALFELLLPESGALGPAISPVQ